VDEFRGLLLDGCNNFRVAVAGGNHGNAGGKVEKLISIHIFNANAAATTGNKRVGARIAGRNQPFVRSDGRFGLWAGQRTVQLGSELRVDLLLRHIYSPGYLRAGTGGGVRDGLAIA
jgi:hypothetical protein